jgi:hypothetical protein
VTSQITEQPDYSGQESDCKESQVKAQVSSPNIKINPNQGLFKGKRGGV